MAQPPDPTPTSPAAPTANATPALPPGPGFGAAFLYYFLGTASITTLLATQTLGLGLETGIPTQFGLLVGGVGGFLGALANRSRTLVVPCPSPKKIKLQLDALLSDMGYREDQDAGFEGIGVYRRSSLRQVLSGNVYVRIDHNQVQIRSRVVHVNAIKRQLEKAGLRPQNDS